MKLRFINSSNMLLLEYDQLPVIKPQAGYTQLTTCTDSGNCDFTIVHADHYSLWMGRFNLDTVCTVSVTAPVAEPCLAFHWPESSGYSIPGAMKNPRAINGWLLDGNNKNPGTFTTISGEGRILLLQYRSTKEITLPNIVIDRSVALVLQQILEYPLFSADLHPYMYHKAMELWLLLKNNSRDEQKPGSLSKMLVQKMEELDKRLHSDISTNYTIASLARLAGMNQTQLKKYFRHWSGRTIHQYIIELKMRQAVEFLENSDKTSREIGFELGYKDDANFSQAFKKYFAYRPGEWRKEYRKDNKISLPVILNRQDDR